jgi:hypothetical protein
MAKNLELKEHLIDLSVDGTLMLMWIFKNWRVELLIGLNYVRIGYSCRFV